MSEYEPPISEVDAQPSQPRTFELRRIGVWSAGRLLGGFYGAIMLVFGGLYGAIAVVASVIGAAVQGDPTILGGAVVGVFIAVLFPLLYAFFGFIGGLLMAAVYNFAAGRLGGLELGLTEAG